MAANTTSSLSANDDNHTCNHFDYSRQFLTIVELEEFVEQYAKTRSFEINKSYDYEFDETGRKVVYRGKILCKDCQSKNNKFNGKDKFILRFSKNSSNVYILKPVSGNGSSCLDHNHALVKKTILHINDVVFVKKKEEVSQEELHFFHEIGPFVGATRLRLSNT